MGNKQRIKETIAVIPDFPKPGISFKDITPILANPEIFDLALKELLNLIKDYKFDCVAGIESRGFWFGVPVAQALHIPFIPIRKKGKLPRETVEASYDLEYGKDILTVHKDDVPKGANVLIVDDIVATGGTLLAVNKMMKKLGANAEHVLLLGHLGELREVLKKLESQGLKVHTLIEF